MEYRYLAPISDDLILRSAEPSDLEAVRELVDALYREDPSPRAVAGHIDLTFNELRSSPNRGVILLCMKGSQAVGYLTLISYWSNEYGGNVVFLDEFYLEPEVRGAGLGESCLRAIIALRPFNAVGLQLETSPGNARARKLYERVGFKPHRNYHLFLEL